MLKKIAAGALVSLALAIPVSAFAATDLSSLNNSIALCLTPPAGTPSSVIEQACNDLIQGLVAIVAQLLGTNPPPVISGSTLTVTAGVQPANTIAPQGAIVPFTNFTISNNGSTALNLVSVLVQRSGTASDAAFYSVALQASDGTIVSTNQLDSDHQAYLGGFSLQPGQSKTFTVIGKMAANLSANAGQTASIQIVKFVDSEPNASVINVPTTGTLPITGATDTVNTTLNACFPPQTSLYGYQCWGGTATTNGSVSLSVDPSSPSSAQIASAGTTGVVASVFKVRATGENVTLNKIGLQLITGKSSSIGNAYVYQAGTLLGAVPFIGSNTSATITLSSPITLVANTDTPLTVKVDLAAIGVNQPGTPGDYVVVGINNLQGTGVNSGATILSSPPAGTPYGIRIFKSYPWVSGVSVPSSSITGSSQPLLRFSVRADNAGMVGISQFAFTIASAGSAAVSSLGLYAYSDSNYSIPVAGQGAGGLIGAGVSPTAPMNTRFFMSPSGVPIEINAGQTYYFELRGTVSGSTGQTALTTTLLGDSGFNGVFNAGTSGNGNFQWSPNDYTTSMFIMGDWTNGFAIPGLPPNGVAQSLTGSGVAVIPSCTTSYSSSTITLGSGPLSITWTSQNAVSRSYKAYTSGGTLFYTSPSIAVSGTLQDTSYNGLAPGTYTRTDTVTSSSGATATCSQMLTIVPASMTPPPPPPPPSPSPEPVPPPTFNPINYACPSNYLKNGVCSLSHIVGVHSQSGLSATFFSFVHPGLVYAVNFGDGSEIQMPVCTLPISGQPNSCGDAGYFTHVYKAAGTYNVSVIDYSCTAGSPACSKIMDSTSVTVSNTASASDQYVNLANALTALSGALQALIAALGQ